jgi:hypothetical protein
MNAELFAHPHPSVLIHAASEALTGCGRVLAVYDDAAPMALLRRRPIGGGGFKHLTVAHTVRTDGADPCKVLIYVATDRSGQVTKSRIIRRANP